MDKNKEAKKYSAKEMFPFLIKATSSRAGACFTREDVERAYVSGWDKAENNTPYNDIRIKASIAAMQGLLVNPSFYGDVTGAEKLADMSVQFADALIEELKKGGNNGHDKGGGRAAPSDEGE